MSAQSLVTTRSVRVPLRWVLTGLAAAAAVVFVGNVFVDHGAKQTGGPAVAAASAAVCLIVAAAVAGLFLSGRSLSDRTAVVLTIVTVLSLPVFWTGLPCVLGGATAATRSRSGSLGVPGWIGAAVIGLVMVWTLLGLAR